MQAIVASICIYATAGSSKKNATPPADCNLCPTVQVEVVYQRWHWGATPLLCHLQYPLQVLYCTVLYYCIVPYCTVLCTMLLQIAAYTMYYLSFGSCRLTYLYTR